MIHLVLCFSVWIVVFISLLWRLIAIAKQAFLHLKRLHQIPCSKCAYFTGDYRLKCTVNPITAMSESAINCRDFLQEDCPSCNNCSAVNTNNKYKYSFLKQITQK